MGSVCLLRGQDLEAWLGSSVGDLSTQYHLH